MSRTESNRHETSRKSYVAVAILSMVTTVALIGLPLSAATAADGDLVWAVNAAEGTRIERGSSIAALPDGSMLVTGAYGDAVFPPGFDYSATFGPGDPNETTLASVNLFDMFVAKYDQDGLLVWATSAGGTGIDDGVAIAALADGSALVTGYFQNTATFGAGESNETSLTTLGTIGLFLAKYNADGTLAWAVDAGGGEGTWAAGNSVAALSDGSALLTGYINVGSVTFGAGEPNETVLTPVGGDNVFVAKYNADGSLAWARSAGGADSGGYGIATLADGSALAAGYFNGTVTFGAGETNETPLTAVGASDIFVAKYDPDGLLDWATSAGGANLDVAYGIAALADGSALVTGSFDVAATFGAGEANETALSALASSTDIFVAQYGPTGLLDWAVSTGTDNSDAGLAVAALSNGAALVTGEYNGTGAGVSDTFVAKFATDGVLDWTKQAFGTVSGDTVLAHGIAVDPGDYVLVTGEFKGVEAMPESGFGSVVFGFGETNETHLLSVDGSADLFVARIEAVPTYRIAGTVTVVGGAASVTDVTLTLSGDDSGTINPNADGTYSFRRLEEGNYTVTPTLAGYIIEPLNRTYEPLNTDQIGQDFLATAVYTISGTVTLIGGTGSVTDVTLTLSGDDSQTISPNADGAFSFTGLVDGNYTITPSLAGYDFEPDFRLYAPLNSDQMNQNFTGTYVPPRYSISGTVLLVGGTASVTDVTLALTNGAIATINPNPDGTYAFSGLLGADYTVTPSLAGYVFEPINRIYEPLNGDQIDQDFLGTYTPETFSISGTVTLIGGAASVTDVTLILSGDASRTISPNADGTYAFTDLPVGNYIVVPSLPEYVFAPTNRQYAPLESDQTGQDFIGTYTPGTFTISGTVTLVGGPGSPTDVALVLTGDLMTWITYTNPDGTYTFTGIPVGNYVLRPSMPDSTYRPPYKFDPPDRSYTPLDSDQTEQDFTGRQGKRGGSGEPCFIATAAYGTPISDEVWALREFRDEHLLTNRVGAAFVRAYYRFSPPVARFIATRESLRAAVRAVLTPLVGIARLARTVTAGPQAATGIVVAGLGLAVCAGAGRSRPASKSAPAGSEEQTRA